MFLRVAFWPAKVVAVLDLVIAIAESLFEFSSRVTVGGFIALRCCRDLREIRRLFLLWFDSTPVLYSGNPNRCKIRAFSRSLLTGRPGDRGGLFARRDAEDDARPPVGKQLGESCQRQPDSGPDNPPRADCCWPGPGYW